MGQIILLRIAHGLFAGYFLACLLYLYFAAIAGVFDYLLVVAAISLAAEGIFIFVFNKGDCPLIHVQRKIGDDKPFFELFFPPALAKQALPLFAKFTWLAVALLLVRFVFR